MCLLVYYIKLLLFEKRPDFYFSFSRFLFNRTLNRVTIIGNLAL